MDANCSSGSASNSVNKLLQQLQNKPAVFPRFQPSFSNSENNIQKDVLDVSLNPQESQYFESIFNQQHLQIQENHQQYHHEHQHETNFQIGKISRFDFDEFDRFGDDAGWSAEEFKRFDNATNTISTLELQDLERKFNSINENWNSQFSRFEDVTGDGSHFDNAFQKFAEFEQLGHFDTVATTPKNHVLQSDNLDVNDNSSDQIASEWASDFFSNHQYTRVPSGEYPFELENPFLSHPDPLSEALKLQQDGNLSDSILAYEAHLQSNSGDSQTWSVLGQLQAENEKEVPAILALQHALTVDPSLSAALLSLSVSYTNEGYDDEAYKLLYRWCREKYNLSSDVDVDITPSYELYNIITDTLLERVRSTGAIDPDTQIALGLAFYNAGQQDKSIDCFKTALSVRPDDYTLWNRVGATLANSGQSEQAIEAYFKALDIKPSYVRARYNLGVSCMNIGCFKDAAEHFLGALSICGGGRNVADNLWDTLRRCFILMERSDLVEIAKNGTNLDMFRQDFEF